MRKPTTLPEKNILTRREPKKRKNLKSHLFSSKKFLTPSTKSAHRLPTYSFLPAPCGEAVRCRDGNLYIIFPYNGSNMQSGHLIYSCKRRFEITLLHITASIQLCAHHLTHVNMILLDIQFI